MMMSSGSGSSSGSSESTPRPAEESTEPSSLLQFEASPGGTPDPAMFASTGSGDSMALDDSLLGTSPSDMSAASLLLAHAAAASNTGASSGSGDGGANALLANGAGGEVLRKVIGDLKELEVEASSSSVKEGIADQRRQLTALLRATVQRRIRKAVTGDETKRVRDHIREPPVARRIDKMAFTFGVLNLAISEFMLLKAPEHFWVWYMAVIPVLVFFRIPHYRSLKWEFFLLDFCYYVQVLCLLQLYTFPDSCVLLKSNFLLANGPLAWAVPVWRNSLVFHDVEKITSLYIHIFPGLLLYATRWYPSTPAAAATLERCGSMAGGDLATACALYIAWQVLYYIKIEVLDRAKLDADPELQTSLRWLAKDTKNPLHKLVLKLTRATGVLAPDERFNHTEVKTKAIFIATQFVYTLLTCLPAVAVYGSFPAHVAYGVALFTIAVFNGANYYIEVFSVRYATKYPHERPLGLGPGRRRKEPVGAAAGATNAAAIVQSLAMPPVIAAAVEDGGAAKAKEA